MGANGAARVDWSSGILVSGSFHIDTVDSPFGGAAFRISATAADSGAR
jgi:hypothetical protein